MNIHRRKTQGGADFPGGLLLINPRSSKNLFSDGRPPVAAVGRNVFESGDAKCSRDMRARPKDAQEQISGGLLSPLLEPAL